MNKCADCEKLIAENVTEVKNVENFLRAIGHGWTLPLSSDDRKELLKATHESYLRWMQWKEDAQKAQDAAEAERDTLLAALSEARDTVSLLQKWSQPDSVQGNGDYDQGLVCGVEDRGFQTDGYSAMRFGYDRAIERVSEKIDGPIAALLTKLNAILP